MLSSEDDDIRSLFVLYLIKGASKRTKSIEKAYCLNLNAIALS